MPVHFPMRWGLEATMGDSSMNRVHYNDVIMDTMASQTPTSRLITQPFIQAQIKENIKAPRDWALCGEFTGNRYIPSTKGQ